MIYFDWLEGLLLGLKHNFCILEFILIKSFETQNLFESIIKLNENLKESRAQEDTTGYIVISY